MISDDPYVRGLNAVDLAAWVTLTPSQQSMCRQAQIAPSAFLARKTGGASQRDPFEAGFSDLDRAAWLELSADQQTMCREGSVSPAVFLRNKLHSKLERQR